MRTSYIALLALVAFGSGAAALIHEIVWFQLLELTLGSRAVSLAVVLATFMGGMGLGSFLFPRLIPARRDPLRVYAALEIGIAASGLLVLLLLPFAGRVYAAWAGYGLEGFLLRGIFASACLLPPTLLMGATLPALARSVPATPEGVSRIGIFYGANIAGAVLGCLLAGFYLLRVHDVVTAVLAAVLINAAAAGTSFALRSVATPPEETGDAGQEAQVALPAATVYVVIALSGFSALAAEAIWTRTLGLLFGASVYGLSIILAVFLMGLGLGSGIASQLARTVSDARVALGVCQWLAAGAMAWTAYTVSASLPYWPIDPSISPNIAFNFQLDLGRALWALLPPTLLWGASFPLALAAVRAGTEDSARLVAGVYAANTAGAVAGALAASLFLVTWAGSQGAQQLLIGLSAAGGLLLLPWTRSGVAAGFAASLLAIACALSVPPMSALLIAHGRFAATWAGKSDIVYAEEGLDASVAVSIFPGGVRTFHVAGKIQASSAPRDMRLQRMLGHLATLTAAAPRSVLVIGHGAGVTVGAVSIDPGVEQVTIVEIEPLVPEAASTWFGNYNFDVLDDPRVEVRIDDGRHYLLTSKERFDVITADPLDPWVKGAANLYTREFLEVVRERLNPGGVVTMYMQLFETTPEAVRSAAATFFEIFPNATLWGNTFQGEGYDLVLLGQAGPFHVDLDEMTARLGRPEYARLAGSLDEIGLGTPLDLFATYAGRGSDLAAWLRDAPLNRDWDLRLQYLAGTGLNLDESAAIYSGLLAYRRFPEDLFTSREGRVERLRDAMPGRSGL